jgi:peroxiredoxin
MRAGSAIRWRRLTNAQTDIRLQLKRESRFRGVLTDETGEPVPGADIRVLQLMSLNTLTKIDVAAGHTPSANGDSFLDISESIARIGTSTDSQGRFVLAQLPDRVGMLLDVADRRLVDTKIYAATTDEQLAPIPAGERIVPPRPENVQEIMNQRVKAELLPIYTSGADVAIARSVHLRLRVLSDATSEPVAGVAASLGHELPVALSDRQGMCDFYRLEPGSTLTLELRPPGMTDLLGRRDTLELSSRLEVEREIRLERGAVVAGRVVDAKTGDGVEGATVSFIPEDEARQGVVTGRQDTDPTGGFHLVVPEIRGRVVLVSAPDGYVTPAAVAAADASSGDSTAALRPQLDRPIEGMRLAVAAQPAIPIRFVDSDGSPVAATATVRVYSSSNSYRTTEVQVDAMGRLNVGHLVRGRETPTAIQILARGTDRHLAGFFRTKQVADLQVERAKEIVLRPTGSVRGRVLDGETGEPIAGATVSLSVYYTATGGQGVGTCTCDPRGEYRFDNLVPGMRYSLGAGAAGYASLNSIHTQFVAADGGSHAIDVSLTPEKPEAIADLTAVEAPSIDGLAPRAAYQLLVRRYAEAKDAYRALLDKHRSDQITARIVELREPNPVYAAAFMQLANRADVRGTAVELQALKWLCDVSLIAGTEQRYRHLKAEAAARLLQDYAEVAEIADVVPDIIYASPDRYAAAQRLMSSPHREVRGRACFTCAGVLEQRYQDPYRGRQDALRQRAIELYEQVIAEFADIPYRSDRTLADAAGDHLFALRHLQIGAPAPEIEGADLEGRPMKLSDFRGQVVVIRYWQSGLAFFDDLQRIADEYRDKPLVILGVNTDDDREKAREVAARQAAAFRHWHDPQREIHRRWSGSWPDTHVIGRDGTILYLGQRRSPAALEDVLDAAVAR